MNLLKYNCKNFKRGYIPCELCLIHKTYVDLQNTECESCFEADVNPIKPV